MEALKRNLKRIFAIIYGQRSPAIHNCIEASSEWKDIFKSADPIRLLKLIQKSLYSQTTNKKDEHALYLAEASLWRYTQGRCQTTADYVEKFKNLVEVVKHLGGRPGVTPKFIEHM